MIYLEGTHHPNKTNSQSYHPTRELEWQRPYTPAGGLSPFPASPGEVITTLEFVLISPLSFQKIRSFHPTWYGGYAASDTQLPSTGPSHKRRV